MFQPWTSSGGCNRSWRLRLPGIALYMQPVQDLTVEDRISRTQYQYALDAPDKATLDQWVPRLQERLQQLPELRDVASDLAEWRRRVCAW